MIPRARIYNLVSRFIMENNLKTKDEFINKFPDIYNLLKTENCLPPDLTYDIFRVEALKGQILAQFKNQEGFIHGFNVRR